MQKGKLSMVILFFVCLILIISVYCWVNNGWNTDDLMYIVCDKVDFEKVDSIDASFFDVYQLNLSLGQSAYGLSSADFNDDGWLDFVVSYATHPFTYSTISIFYNNGDLTFEQDDIFSCNYSYIQDVDAADFDNDNDIDLLFSFNEHSWHDGLPYNMNGTLVLSINDGMNDFLNVSVVSRRISDTIMDPEQRINQQVTSADYDLDGDIDLMVGDNSGKIELFLNNGKGIFNSSGIIEDFGSLSWGLTSVDVNDDGYLDVVVAAAVDDRNSSFSGCLYVLENSGDIDCFKRDAWRAIGTISEGLGTGCLLSLDIDNDSDVDVIAGVADGLYVFERENNSYWSRCMYRFPMTSEGHYEDLSKGGMCAGDFNNDGYIDFITGGVQGIVRLFISNQNLKHVVKP